MGKVVAAGAFLSFKNVLPPHTKSLCSSGDEGSEWWQWEQKIKTMLRQDLLDEI